ncbi:hypothetical protein CY35_12G082700 [Sphagnum magellanicum]|nr:hypothetical protein CY35_12G082700 [Sphagnum magellanicum]KAH9546214.1 hypothetical protein CY35_12G082700 [Sphagnum magellanicum]
MASLAMASASSVAVSSAVPTGSLPAASFSCVRIAAPQRFGWRRSSLPPVVAMATPRGSGVEADSDIGARVAKSAEEALKTCKDDETSAPCAAAWDEYEELSAEQAHSRDRKKLSADPLEVYCAENPETDECRVYED